jgi:hypothetical protein
MEIVNRVKICLVIILLICRQIIEQLWKCFNLTNGAVKYNVFCILQSQSEKFVRFLEVRLCSSKGHFYFFETKLIPTPSDSPYRFVRRYIDYKKRHQDVFPFCKY